MCDSNFCNTVHRTELFLSLGGLCSYSDHSEHAENTSNSNTLDCVKMKWPHNMSLFTMLYFI